MMSRLRMIIVPKIPRMTHVNKKSPGVFGERFVTSRAWGLMYNGLIGSVNGLISFLRHSFTISPQSSQTLKIQPLRLRPGVTLLAVVGVLLSARAHAQKLGFGGTGSMKHHSCRFVTSRWALSPSSRKRRSSILLSRPCRRSFAP
jgi:hypothetical protein